MNNQKDEKQSQWMIISLAVSIKIIKCQLAGNKNPANGSEKRSIQIEYMIYEVFDKFLNGKFSRAKLLAAGRTEFCVLSFLKAAIRTDHIRPV
jgi:hypothetical protein